MKESQRECSRQSKLHFQKSGGKMEGTAESLRKGRWGGACGGEAARGQGPASAQILFCFSVGEATKGEG